MIQEPVTIPARSEVDVPTMVIFHNMSAVKLSDDGVWMSEASDIGEGIQSARTLTPQRAKDVPIRMMNVMDTDIHLSRRTAVSDMNPVEIVSRATTSEEDKFQTREQCRDDLVSGVDSCLRAEDRAGLTRLLTEFQTILSIDEYDMGQTDIAHHIDTADHRPLRQTLRRHHLPH